jgi:acetyl esterase
MPLAPVWDVPSTGRIDPQAQALLDVFARARRITEPRDDRYIAILRAGFPAFTRLAGPAEPVDHVEDFQIEGPRGAIPLRLYRPRSDAPRPLLIWVHGGGFILGDLDTCDVPLRALANRSGCAVLAVDYRLAPEHPFPAGIEDGYAALVWAAAQAREFGASRIAIGGDSAGGNIATAVAMLARERNAPGVALQVLIYPDADARAGFNYASWRDNDGCVLDRAAKDRQLALYLASDIDRTQPHVSPALASTQTLAGLPPTLIVTGEFDPQRDEGELYAARLREAQVPVALHRYPGMIHGFFQMGAKLDAARHLIARVADAVARV